MRTTLAIEDDAMEDLHAYARANDLYLGKAASELIRRGRRFEIGTRRDHGLLVFDVPNDFPVITTEQVRKVLEEE